jgi:hypothetical protein
MNQDKQTNKKVIAIIGSSPSPTHEILKALMGEGLPEGKIVLLAAPSGEGESKIFPDKNRYSVDFEHKEEYTIVDIEKAIEVNRDKLSEDMFRTIEDVIQEMNKPQSFSISAQQLNPYPNRAERRRNKFK